jgi:P-type Mg2+ transporter
VTVVQARKAHSGPGAVPHPAASGLSSAEARGRLKECGPNELAAPNEPAWKAVLPLIADPLVLILIIASIVAAAVGEITDAVIINAMVITSVALNFTKTYRSQRAAHRLREQVAAAALALRDSVWETVLRRELVPGDVIRLAAGDLVPADALFSPRVIITCTRQR